MWPSLLEVIVSVVMVGVSGVVLFTGMSTAARGDVLSGQRTHGEALLVSVMESVTRDGYVAYPTAGGYPAQGAGIPNPEGYPVGISVLNYAPGTTPDFSSGYADSGLQEVVVEVSLPDGQTLKSSLYKVR